MRDGWGVSEQPIWVDADRGADGTDDVTVGSVFEPARWYHLQGRNDRHGPLELDAMRRLVAAGIVGPDTYVWADGMPDWRFARDVPAVTPPPSLRATLPAWLP